MFGTDTGFGTDLMSIVLLDTAASADELKTLVEILHTINVHSNGN